MANPRTHQRNHTGVLVGMNVVPPIAIAISDPAMRSARISRFVHWLIGFPPQGMAVPFLIASFVTPFDRAKAALLLDLRSSRPKIGLTFCHR